MSDSTPTMPARTVALNYFSILFVAAGLAVAIFTAAHWPGRILIFAGWLYLLPPLMARFIIAIRGLPTGIVRHDSPIQDTWWMLFQLQLIFNRLPALEELLRLIPGLYSAWLRLWGADVSLFIFWTPGVVVMDRCHLRIGKGAILGAGCIISGHVMKVQDDRSIILAVDEVHVGAGALIGAGASITPGCRVGDFETVTAGMILKPYTLIENGKRHSTLNVSTVQASPEKK